LNSNRGNNRRRGRNNNRSQGGGQHLNRIDSRARGNAPQLLDKYKKLAEEASRNGDRVQAEYYLQFADHYFRVIADGKARQDEQRQKREDARGDRDSDDDTNEDEYDNRGNDSDREPRSRRESSDDNPFVRDNRQRRSRRQRDDEQAADNDETEDSVKNSGGLDPQALPPAIGDTGSDDAPAEKPKRTRRPRKPKVAESEAAGGDDSDMQQAVNG